jgi:hypothetical protein
VSGTLTATQLAAGAPSSAYRLASTFFFLAGLAILVLPFLID